LATAGPGKSEQAAASGGQGPSHSQQSAFPLLALAKHAQGCRVIEAITDPSTPLSSSLLNKLVRTFTGHYREMALHPNGSFAVTALYRAASPEAKTALVGELLEIEEELKAANYAVYRRCELPRYKKSKEEWEARQEKKSKARALFQDILAAREDEERRNTSRSAAGNVDEDEEVAQLKQDPVASLLLEAAPIKDEDEGTTEAISTASVGGAGGGKDKRAKDRRKGKDKGRQQMSQDISAPSEQEPTEESRALDKLFSHAERKSRKRRNKSRDDEGCAVQPAEEPEQAKDKDASLTSVLSFIEGTSKRALKKRKKEQKMLEATKAAGHEDEGDSDSDARGDDWPTTPQRGGASDRQKRELMDRLRKKGQGGKDGAKRGKNKFMMS